MSYILDRVKSIPSFSVGSYTAKPQFYLYSQEIGEFFELSLTSEVSVESVAEVTEHKAEDKTIISSNVVARGDKILYNGIITDVKSISFSQYEYAGGKRDVATYLETIKDLQLRGTLFNCYIDKRLNPIKNCIITSFNKKRGMKEGMFEWSVQLELKEVRLSSVIGSTFIPEPALPDTTNGKSEQSETTTSAGTVKGKQKTFYGKFITGG